MESLVYLNDRFVGLDEAKISVFDLSVLRGYGVFEYLRTYQKEPFHLEDHLKRLKRSAAQVGIPLPKSLDEIEALVFETIQQAAFQEVSIKIVITGGASEDYYLPEDRPNFLIIAYPYAPYPEIFYEQGVRLITKTFARSFPTAKTIEYLPAIVAMKEAKKVGAEDVLFIDSKGSILETGTANFFAFKGGTLITPGEGVLPGITRQVVLELAQELCPIEIREIKAEEIPTFDGAFITSSNKEVMPVSQIDDTLLGQGKIYPMINQLIEKFTEYSRHFFCKK